MRMDQSAPLTINLSEENIFLEPKAETNFAQEDSGKSKAKTVVERRERAREIVRLF